MSLVSTRVLMVVGAPQNGCQQHLCPQGELHLSPASLEGSPRPASGSDRVPFKLLLLHWVLECVRFSVHHFMNRVSVSYSHMAFPCASPTGLQSQMFRGSSSRCRTPGIGSLMWGSDSSLLGENLCSCDYLPICGSPS